MPTPAKIRTSVQAPFPATVTGSGQISITKRNGIWTLALLPNTDQTFHDLVATTLTVNGALTISNGASSPVRLTHDAGASGYNLLALNGATTFTAAIGIEGGATGDPNLYIYSQGVYLFAVAASIVATIGGTGNLAIAGSAVPAHRLDILAGGTAAVAQIRLKSGTNLTTAAAGCIEYDGVAAYLTPAATNRGVIAVEHFLSLSADQTGGNVNTAQTWFPGGGATTITLPASTSYFFEGQLSLSRTAGGNAHTISLLFGGGATFTSIAYRAHVTDQNAAASSLAAEQVLDVNVATAVAITAGSGNANQFNSVHVRGIVRIAAGGTFIPQFKYDVAPGGAPTVQANSFFRMRAIGSDTVLSVGQWS